MRQLVDEALKGERQGVAARRPQRSRRRAQGHERRAQLEVGDESCRKFLGAARRVVGDLVAFPEGYEGVGECLQLAVRIQPRLEKMKSRGTIEIVPEVVFPAPYQLDRCADLLGYPGGLGHVVV